MLSANVLLVNEVAGVAVTFALVIAADPELIVGAVSLFAIPVKVYVFALVKVVVPS